MKCSIDCPYLIMKWNNQFNGIIYQQNLFYCSRCPVYNINMWTSPNYIPCMQIKNIMTHEQIGFDNQNRI